MHTKIIRPSQIIMFGKAVLGTIAEYAGAAAATAVLGKKGADLFHPYEDIPPNTQAPRPPPANSPSTSWSSSSTVTNNSASPPPTEVTPEDLNNLRLRLRILEAQRIHETTRQEALDMMGRWVDQDIIQEAYRDVSAAQELKLDVPAMESRLLSSGLSSSRWQSIVERVRLRLGNSQQARATLRRVIINRILPAVAGATVTYGLGKAWPVDKDKKGGVAEVSEEEEISHATNDVDDPGASLFNSSIRAPHSAFDKNAFNKAYNSLPGSASGTASPDLPFGPTDTVLPKSAPNIPTSGPAPISRLPGTAIFTDGLSGDSLSERPSMIAANVLKSTIPVPPTISYLSSRQSYADIEQRYMPPPTQPAPSPLQNLKRKAESEVLHHDRNLETQIPQNYDPTFVPGMPSSVNANSSSQWKEYSQPYRGYNVPLDAAPNIAELYTEATSERDLAETAQSPQTDPSQHDNSQNKESRLEPAATPKLQDNQINTANETNPSLRNTQKEKPTPAPQVIPTTSALKP